jgi:hypothetical protein
VGERVTLDDLDRRLVAALQLNGRASWTPGYGDLYHYMTHVVGALPGVRTADMTLQARTLKRAWVRINPDGTRERAT